MQNSLMSPQPSLSRTKVADGTTSVTTSVRNRLSKVSHRKSSEPDKSLFIFSENNLIRRIVKTIIEFRCFEYAIILTILANCISLALEVHLPNKDRTYLMMKMDTAEPIYLFIFTAEAVLKIMALGFILNDGSYMRSMWNVMDFIVVTTGLITINLSANTDIDLRFFRAIRVLRPLKLVKGIPSLQVVITSIIKAMAPLLKIGLLVLFLIMMFGIIGLELYRGIFNFTCWKIDDPDICAMPKRPCSPQKNNSCPLGYICRIPWEGPYFGFVNFDNIGFSMLTVFQCITMEGWTDILYATNKATGSQVNVLYYIPLIILGSFFMLNLILGVLSGEFAKERERVEKRKAFLKLREKQREQDMLDGYIYWVEVAEEAAMMESRRYQEGRDFILRYRKEALEHVGDWQMVSLYDEEAEEGNTKRDTKTRLCLCCVECIKHLRLLIRLLIKTQFFYWGVIVLVLLNTACVSLEHYNQPLYLDDFLFYAEYVFLSIFLAEIVLKIFGLGFKTYFRSKFNRFDFLVVLMSTFEVVYQFFNPNQSFGFSALRCIRLLRLLRLTRYWSSLRNLVLSLLSSMRSIISLLLLLGLFIFILTLLGMQLFGGDFNFEEGVPSLNFDTFTNALITVFVILTGENWNEVMYDGVRSQIKSKDGKNVSMIYSTYFLLIVVFGNYTLLNVFLAIAVDNLANAAELSAAEQEECEHTEKRLEDIGNKELSKLQKEGLLPQEEDIERSEKLNLSKPRTLQDECNTSGGVNEESNKLGKVMLPYSSLFIFGPTIFPRKFCHFVVNLRFFDLFIMMVIFASSLALAAEDPVIEDCYRNKLLENFDYAFTSVFLAEMILKIIDMGIILHPGAYMRDPWNIMDMFVVTIAVFSFLYKNLNTIKSLRVLRVLRPLKTINRVPQLKAVFKTIIYSVKNVLNILSVFIIFQFIFAVVAVQLFKGKFFYCTDISKRTIEKCKGFFITFTEGMTMEVKPRNWLRQSFHFDNLLHSMNTLFTVTTGEGWPTVLKNSMYSTFYNEGPLENYRQEMAIFYIVFFVVFPFFFVNIFVAFIIITFQEQGESEIIDPDLDKNQRKCIDFAINAQPISRFMPENKRSICYKMWVLVLSTPFEYLIMTLIALNCVILVIKSHTKIPEPSKDFSPAAIHELGTQINLCLSLNHLNVAFTVIFSLECILKLIAFRVKHYFKDAWNIFDFITVIGSITYVLLSEIKSEDNPPNLPNLGFLRLFRAMRLLKILRRHSGIRTLLWTFVQSFKALPWVCLLIGLLFFIYCIIGMQVFGTIQLNDETQINKENNFRYFPMGLLLLFRCATGESWHTIMLDTTAGKPCECSRFSSTNECIDPPNRTCGSNVAYAYFISFVLVTTFLMLNLFVAVIMDNFDYLTRDSSILGPHHLDEFLRIWAEYDPLGTGWIHVNDMYRMMKHLEPPVGFGLKCPARIAYTKLIRMNMPLDSEMRVNFNTTLFSMIRESLQIKQGPAFKMNSMDEELRASMLILWPELSKEKKIDIFVPLNKVSIPLTVGKIYAVKLMVAKWLLYKKWMEENLKNVLPSSHTSSRKDSTSNRIYMDTNSSHSDEDRHLAMQLSDEMFSRFEDYLRQQEEEMRNIPGPSVLTPEVHPPSSSLFEKITNVIHKIENIVVDRGKQS